MLLAQSRYHRHHPLHKEGAGVALCPEAGLTPDYAVPECSFCSIVGGSYPFSPHQGPQGGLQFQDVSACGRSFGMGTLLSLPQKCPYAVLDRPHIGLKAGALQRAIAHAIPPGEHLCEVGQKVGS